MIDPTPLEVSLADLCAALQEAFLEELGDEDLAVLAAQTALTDHLLEGTWELAESD